MSRYTPFDRDWHALGYLEPEFVEEIVGWYNEEVLCDAGLIPVMSYQSDVPITWVPEAFTVSPLPEPVPKKQTQLRWVWVD